MVELPHRSSSDEAMALALRMSRHLASEPRGGLGRLSDLPLVVTRPWSQDLGQMAFDVQIDGDRTARVVVSVSDA